jgi:hypothetical protein
VRDKTANQSGNYVVAAMTSSNLMTVPWSTDPQPPASSTPAAPNSAQALSPLPQADQTNSPPPAASAPSETRDIAQVEADVDEIEQYFASLLQRVGGGKSAAAEAPSKPSRATVVVEAPPAPASSARVTQVAAAAPSPAPVTASIVEEPAGPKELPPPRAVAETQANLQVLRDVANVHRRGALDRHDCLALMRKAYGVWLMGLSMAGLALWLGLSLPSKGAVQWIAALTGLVGANACTFGYFCLVRRFRRQVSEMSYKVSDLAAVTPPQEKSNA